MCCLAYGHVTARVFPVFLRNGACGNRPGTCLTGVGCWGNGSVNEAAWRDVWDRASFVFAHEAGEFQLTVLLGVLVLMALVLQALAPFLIYMLRGREAAFGSVEQRSGEYRVKTAAVPEAPIKTKPAIVVVRPRKRVVRKRTRPFPIQVKRTGRLGTVPQAFFAPPAPPPNALPDIDAAMREFLEQPEGARLN